jgi:hypothetical protein
MGNALSQVRAVALWYALVGSFCSVGAVVTLSIFLSHSRTEFASLGVGLSIYTSAAVAFLVSAVLSLRFLVLSPAGRIAALVLSILLALSLILAAAGVTLAGWNGLGLIITWWIVAGLCSLCSLLLWRHRRASNNRWRGP